MSTGFFYIVGGSALSKIVGFLSSTILVRLLSKEEYGAFTYSWNIYNMFCLASGLGMISALLQLCSERRKEEKYIASAFSYATKCSTIFDGFLGLAMVASSFLLPPAIKNAKTLLRMMCFLPIVHLQIGLLSIYFRTKGDSRKYAALSLFESVAVLFFVNAGAVICQEIGTILGYYISYVATIYFGVRISNGFFCPQNHVSLQATEKKELWSIALTSMSIEALSQLMYFLDIFILGIVAPEETVLASYRVATIIPTALIFIPNAVVTYIYPYFAENRYNKKWCLATYKNVVIGIGIFNLIVAAVLFAFAPIIICVFFGKQYLDATPIFRLLSINYIFSGTFRIISGNLLVTQRKLKFNFLVVAISSTANIIGNYFFIQWWGAIGAAVATMISVSIAGIMSTSYWIYILKK